MMRCIHCGGIDGDHHELCGGDDTQPPSEGMTLAQIIDKQVARIATQEAEIKALRGPYEKLCKAVHGQSDPGGDFLSYWELASDLMAVCAERDKLNEQLARMPVCVGYMDANDAKLLRQKSYAWESIDISLLPEGSTDAPIYTDPAPQEKQG